MSDCGSRSENAVFESLFNRLSEIGSYAKPMTAHKPEGDILISSKCLTSKISLRTPAGLDVTVTTMGLLCLNLKGST